ncbi:uncharacterized protein LOC116853432 [Odontomachus brunneus]|uniref:uncharacterized protein LOC116853432 n=1 Tax=Odontomachus brunneus TaxID=486640 RepID=UPI0013F24032|nr:uncharacterized protein LOC116853432 [Odontomachus brunneus]
MKWIIVHFVDDNVVEAVPSNWVYDDTCYWPPYKGSKLTQAMSSSPIIDEWEVCRIRQLANGQKYDNLLKAKTKCAKAEHTSDLNSDVEIKRKKKRFFDENNSGDDIAQVNKYPTLRQKTSSSRTSHKRHKKLTPRFPKVQVTLPKMMIYEIHNYLLHHLKVSAVKSSTSQSAVRNKYDVNSTAARKSNHEKENREHLSSIFTFDTSSCETLKSSNNLCDNNFKRQILRQLQIINLRQQQISEDLSVLLTKANSDKNEPITSNKNSIFKTYNFPLKTLPELEELEEFLGQEENFKNLVKEIKQIGGTSYKNMVKRMLPRIMSDDLAKEYSWIGWKGKHNFSNL